MYTHFLCRASGHTHKQTCNERVLYQAFSPSFIKRQKIARCGLSQCDFPPRNAFISLAGAEYCRELQILSDKSCSSLRAALGLLCSDLFRVQSRVACDGMDRPSWRCFVLHKPGQPTASSLQHGLSLHGLRSGCFPQNGSHKRSPLHSALH